MQGGGPHPDCPGGANPSAGQAAGEQIDHYGPVQGEVCERDRDEAGRQCGCHDGQTHRFVEDDGVEGEESEQADEEREPKLGAT